MDGWLLCIGFPKLHGLSLSCNYVKIFTRFVRCLKFNLIILILFHFELISLVKRMLLFETHTTEILQCSSNLKLQINTLTRNMIIMLNTIHKPVKPHDCRLIYVRPTASLCSTQILDKCHS